ncbi:MAG TPA: hypothetical protein VMV10_24510 [Pirellulales bacterium]|nr:hypothetical protein [Pirellulales bacterium]
MRQALTFPVLFKLPPATLISNFDPVVQYFEADGLTRSKYLRVVQSNARLWATRPETVISNINEVATALASTGLTRRNYLTLACKRPALFASNPKTIMTNFHRLNSALGRTMIEIQPHQASEKSSRLALDIVSRNPNLLTLSETDIYLRELLATLQGTSFKASRNKSEIEKRIANALGHDNLNDPVPPIPDGMALDSFTGRLLLRALIHEGLIRGRLK